MVEILDFYLFFEIPNLELPRRSTDHQFRIHAFRLEFEGGNWEVEFHAIDGLMQITPSVDIFAETDTDQVVQGPVKDL